MAQLSVSVAVLAEPSVSTGNVRFTVEFKNPTSLILGINGVDTPSPPVGRTFESFQVGQLLRAVDSWSRIHVPNWERDQHEPYSSPLIDCPMIGNGDTIQSPIACVVSSASSGMSVHILCGGYGGDIFCDGI